MNPLQPLIIFLLGCTIGFFQLADSSQVDNSANHKPVSWPSHFDDIPLQQIKLTQQEKTFQRNFPGTIANFHCGEKQIIFRHITRASRKLHPSADCLRASGHRIGSVHIHTDARNRQWAGFHANQSGTKYMVLERITDTRGNSWTDASSWYWHALLHPNRGPWLAQTIIQRLPSQTQAEHFEGTDKSGF